MGEIIFIFRGIRSDFSLLFQFSMTFQLANRISGVLSGAILFAYVASLIWVQGVTILRNLNNCCKSLILKGTLWSSTASGSDSRRLDLCLASGHSQLRKRE